MKRSEMILNIASDLVHDLTGFMPWNKAQEMADIILTRIEKEGMQPPYAEFKPLYTESVGFPVVKTIWANKWEAE